jgi:hypothetical protein
VPSVKLNCFNILSFVCTQVESYMNSKIKRNPLVSQSCAEYLGYFLVGKQVSRSGIQQGVG